eukprot:Skav203394  [mRNA]  locus=scaffold3093:64961:81312:- [translate_table: standard]
MKNQLNACIAEKIKTQNEHEAHRSVKLPLWIALLKPRNDSHEQSYKNLEIQKKAHSEHQQTRRDKEQMSPALSMASAGQGADDFQEESHYKESQELYRLRAEEATRRSRKQRAAARRHLWLHRRGYICLAPHQLTLAVKRLSNHHSADRPFLYRFLRNLRRPDSDTMELIPWRCKWCYRIMKAKEVKCLTEGCGHAWEVCWDPKYEFKPRKDPEWEWPRAPSHSPSRHATQRQPKSRDSSQHRPKKEKKDQQMLDKGKSAGKGKKGVSDTPFGNQGVPYAMSPFAYAMPYYGAPPAPPPWTPPDVKPSESQASNSDKDFLAAMKTAYPDINAAPAPLREIFERTEAQASRSLTSDMHKTTTSLGKQRKELQMLTEARASHRRAWLQHLAASAKSWKAQLAEYEQTQSGYGEKIQKATEELHSLHRQLQRLNAQAATTSIGGAPSMPDLTLEMSEVNEPSAAEETHLRSHVQAIMESCVATVQPPRQEADAVLDSDEEDSAARERKRLREDKSSPAMASGGNNGQPDAAMPGTNVEAYAPSAWMECAASPECIRDRSEHPQLPHSVLFRADCKFPWHALNTANQLAHEVSLLHGPGHFPNCSVACESHVDFHVGSSPRWDAAFPNDGSDSGLFGLSPSCDLPVSSPSIHFEWTWPRFRFPLDWNDSPSAHLGSDHVAQDQFQDIHEPIPIPPAGPPNTAPGWIRQGWGTLNQVGIRIGNEIGPSINIKSWYIHGVHLRENSISRRHRFDWQWESWDYKIRSIWSDYIDPLVPLHVVWVNPPPPDRQGEAPNTWHHLLLFQEPVDTEVPVIATVRKPDNFCLRMQQAMFLPRMVQFRAIYNWLDIGLHDANVDRIDIGRTALSTRIEWRALHAGTVVTVTLECGSRHLRTPSLASSASSSSGDGSEDNVAMIGGLPIFLDRFPPSPSDDPSPQDPADDNTHLMQHRISHTTPQSHPSATSAGPVEAPPAESNTLQLGDITFQFDDLAEVWSSWSQYAATECEEEGPVCYYMSFYVDPQHPVCQRHRAVRLLHSEFSWITEIYQTWSDMIDPLAPVLIHHVYPRPPHGINSGRGGHLVVQQHKEPNRCAYHLTECGASHHPLYTVQLAPPMLDKARVLYDSARLDDCAIPSYHCQAWYDGVEIVDLPIPCYDGMGVVLTIQRNAPPPAVRNVMLALSDTTAYDRALGSSEPRSPPHAAASSEQACGSSPVFDTSGSTSGSTHTPTVLTLDDLVPMANNFRYVSLDLSPASRALQTIMDFPLPTLPDWPTSLIWTSPVETALRALPVWSGQPPLAYQFYTDGSQCKGRLGSGVVLTVYTEQGLYLGGILASRSPGSHNGHSEHAAMGWALIWANQIVKWHRSTFPVSWPHCSFNFDACTTGMLAQGSWTAHADVSWKRFLRSLELILRSQCGSAITWNHVPAHQGHFFNEGADCLAKYAAVHLEFGPHPFELCSQGLSDSSLEWAWTFARDEQAPSFSGTVTFPVPCPSSVEPASQPEVTLQPVSECSSSSPGSWTALSLRFATANVLTLRDDSGWDVPPEALVGTRQQLLMEQFRQERFHIVGVQETRHRHATISQSESFLMVGHPALDSGLEGIQIWFNLVDSFAAHARPFSVHDIKVIHSTSNLMIVRVMHPLLRCCVVCCHAPHSAHPQPHIDAYWTNLSGIIDRKCKDLPVVFLGDSNAHLGDAPSTAVGTYDPVAENPAGQRFHEWCLAHHVYLPATFAHCHVGPSLTCLYPGNRGGARLDYIGLPIDLHIEDVSSWVSQSIDLSTVRVDHLAACCTCTWWVQSSKSPPSRVAPVEECPPAPPGSMIPCDVCSAMFPDKRALARHRHQVHQLHSVERGFIQSTRCGACMRNFHTSHRLLQHLKYHPNQCLWKLQQFREPDTPVNVSLPAESKNIARLPCERQCAGPLLPSFLELHRSRQLTVLWTCRHHPLFEFLTHATHPSALWWTSMWTRFVGVGVPSYRDPSFDADTWIDRCMTIIDESSVTHAMGTVCLFRWLRHVCDDHFLMPPASDVRHAMLPGEQQLWDFLENLEAIQYCWTYHRALLALDSPPAEPSHRASSSSVPASGSSTSRSAIVSNFGLLASWEASIHHCWTACDPIHEGRVSCTLRIVLHLYSGQRRSGDFQWWSEGLLGRSHPDVVYISVDTAIHGRFNVFDRALWTFLMDCAAAGAIVSMLCGPPCESWSAARALQLYAEDGTAQRGPRPLRDRLHPWGVRDRSLRELSQLHIGSVLLLRALLLAVRAAHNGARVILEHPGLPSDPGMASVWHTTLVALLTETRNFFYVTDIMQYQFGSPAVKPTRLLFANLALDRLMLLYARTDLVKPAIALCGKREDGAFATAVAKQYPALLNQAFALATAQDFPVVNSSTQPAADELVKSARFYSSLCCELGGHQQPDYQPQAELLYAVDFQSQLMQRKVEQLDKQMEEQKSLHSILQAQIKRQDKPGGSHGAGDIEIAS